MRWRVCYQRRLPRLVLADNVVKLVGGVPVLKEANPSSLVQIQVVRYAKNIANIWTRNALEISKICLRYVQDI